MSVPDGSPPVPAVAGAAVAPELDGAAVPEPSSPLTVAVVAVLAGLFVVTGIAAARSPQSWDPSETAGQTVAGSPTLPSVDSIPVDGVELTASVLGGPNPGAGPASSAASDATPAPVAVRVIDPAWVADVAAGTGIPGPAVRAYGTAVLRLQDEQPACRLGWTTLAAIGEIESGHGTGHGAELREDGTTTVTIVGPALSGGPDYAALPASPLGTSLHGDPVWEHAVGPMQFLPSTWQRWAADGDGDGRADPNDVDDAVLAAAHYLCASGADLQTGAGWQRAVFSYNHSDAYVEKVRAIANRFAGAR